MKDLRTIKWSAFSVVLVLAFLCFGPWHESYFSTVIIAITKVVGLYAIFLLPLESFDRVPLPTRIVQTGSFSACPFSHRLLVRVGFATTKSLLVSTLPFHPSQIRFS